MSCRRAAVRKLIPWAPEGMADEKCRSAAWRGCPTWIEHSEAAVDGGFCPLLEESLVQYCSATPVRKFVPYSESSVCRCGAGGYRYCDAYLTLARPRDPGGAVPPANHADGREETIEGIRVPDWLYYTGNHMWADVSEDGCCHLGIDGFAARLFGDVERVSFVTQRGMSRPTAVLRIHGADLQLVFPNPIEITASNLYLRADPSRLTAEPYTQGWLFQGRMAARNGFLTGAEAVAWMKKEVMRLPAPSGGGREELLRLFHDFFSPCASCKGQL